MERILCPTCLKMFEYYMFNGAENCLECRNIYHIHLDGEPKKKFIQNKKSTQTKTASNNRHQRTA